MGNLLSELKRRKVFRAAVLYVVVAWVMLQVADTLAPMLNLSDSAPRLVLFLLVILFPVALLLAWLYDITPDTADTRPSSAGAGGFPVPALLSILAIAVIAGLYLVNREPPATPEATTAEPAANLEDKSIAVLPFSAFSADPNEQYFADGLSDTLLNKLAQLGAMRVISRTSSFQYRGDAVDVRQIGEELGVATVLEGSVQRSGDQLRIIAQLIDTRDGSHIFSRNFDRPSNDLFAVQDEIAEAVAQALQVSLSPEDQQRLSDYGTDSLEAYNRLILLREGWDDLSLFSLTDEEQEAAALRHVANLQALLELDPDYAEVYREIANTYSTLVFATNDNDIYERYLRRARAALNQAMLVEPVNSDNLSIYADLLRRSGDPLTAEVFARMAYAIDPGNVYAAAELLLDLLNQGGKNLDEMIQLTELERAVSPNNDFTNRRYARVLEITGDYDEALAVMVERINRASEPELLAFDIMDMQSQTLGRHTDAIRSLTRIRDSLEDTFSENFAAAWATLAGNLGLTEEVDRMKTRVPSANLDRQLRADTNLQILKSRLETEPAQRTQRAASLGEVCLLLRDFPCAIGAYTDYFVSRDLWIDGAPQLTGGSTYEIGLRLAAAYAATGETAALENLVTQLTNYRIERTYNGFFHTRYYYEADYRLLLGETDAALQAMRENIMLPGDDFIPQCTFCSFDSPVYDAVRDDPEFISLVDEFERRRAASARAVETLIAEAGY